MLGKLKHLVQLSKYLGTDILDYKVRQCLALQETAKMSSRMYIPFGILISNEWELCCSTSTLAFVCFVFAFYFTHPIGM